MSAAPMARGFNDRSNGADVRVYVACLACYNDGRLHGVWLDAAADADDNFATVAELQAVCGHTDNDHAIHDHEGFRGAPVGEYTSLRDVTTLAAAIEEHGEAFAAWLGNGNDADTVEQFEDAYRGCFRSLVEYAEQLIDDMGTLAGADSLVARYFDYAAFAHDMQVGGDVWTHEGTDGVHVFDNHV